MQLYMVVLFNFNHATLQTTKMASLQCVMMMCPSHTQKEHMHNFT